MAYKLINATEAKVGSAIMIEEEPCVVRSIDISKTGKHGHAKCRIEAVGIIDGKKRVIAIPGHERLEVPLIEKRRAQVLSIGEEKASVMDLESFETIDVPFEEELKETLKLENQVEYWDIQGVKVIKKIL